VSHMLQLQSANSESSEVCGIIKPGRRVKLNRSKAVNVHKLLFVYGQGYSRLRDNNIRNIRTHGALLRNVQIILSM